MKKAITFDTYSRLVFLILAMILLAGGSAFAATDKEKPTQACQSAKQLDSASISVTGG